jgi:serine/threonine-protein kinase
MAHTSNGIAGPAVSDTAPQSAEDTWIGRVVDGRYRVLEHIGHGGMGAVYKVVHTQIGKVAAMKLLHGSLVGDKDLIKRFRREAEAISKLSHPNIVQVFDFGRAGDSVYLVMEYLKGEDLGTILRRDGPIDFPRAAPILIQICEALAEAHEQRIIHRDLKPENVSISRTRDGKDYVKVLDFGLAKMLEDEKDPSITAEGNLVGTPYYMAPEMIRAETLDHRCDIYSLGAMAYRMLTGENAFTAKTPVGVLTKHITDDLTPPSGRAPERPIPPEVDDIVLKAMAKKPDGRFQSALELKGALITALERIPPEERDEHALKPWESHSAPIIREQRRVSDANATTLPGDLAFSPTGRIDESLPAVGPVLSKEDLAFERRMRGGRFTKLLFLLPLLGAVALGIWWLGPRKAGIYIPSEEIEPNNAPEKATPLFHDHPVTGHIGQRVSTTESDRDWYRFQIEGSGPQTVRVQVSGIPNMDLALELHDGLGGRITSVDSAGKGGGEGITNWTVDPGTYFVLVREVWAEQVPPTENVTDAYHLKATWQPYASGWEMEPNDQPAQASPVGAGGTLRGYLGRVDDVDLFQVEAPAGVVAGVASGVRDVDLVLEVTSSAGGQPTVFDSEGLSGGEHFDNVSADGKSPVMILIRRKIRDKVLTGGDAPGLDVPYVLKVWSRPPGGR